LREIAAALQLQELSRAMVCALQMRLCEIPENALARVTRVDRMLKYNFNPLQPRDWHGRWSDYSSGRITPARTASTPRSWSSRGRAWERFPNAEFRNRLAIAEGSADKGDFGYSEIHQTADALGRYQMRLDARRAAGMNDANGNWTGKYGIHSRAEFLADHVAQEKALTDYLLDLERQLRANGSLDFVGKTIDGLRDRFQITHAGLLAAAHREGARATRAYLMQVEQNGLSSRGLPLSREMLAIETWLRAFADIPYR
jgi:hypothetical protein